MKVLLVHNEYRQPGEEVVVEQERRLLEAAGHVVVPFRRSNWDVEDVSGFEQLVLAKNIVWSSNARRDIAKVLDDEKPDVVHVHNTFMAISPSIYSACQQAGVPVVQTLHNYRLFCPAAFFFRDGKVCEECVEHSLLRGIRYGCYRDSKSATAGLAAMLKFHRIAGTWNRDIDTYVALTQFARTRFVEAGLPEEKVTVKPNFVADPGRRTEPGQYALFAGRLSPEKGVSIILQAWKQLKVRVPLRILGDGPLLEPLQREAQELGLQGVVFTGRLDREQTMATVKGASFLIFPSRWYESFPMIIVESFASGTPVIGSRLGAIQEIVEDGRTGLHFTPGDPEALAERVEYAWTHPEKVRAMSAEAREVYETRYSAEKNYHLLMAIYERALSRGSARTAFSGEGVRKQPEIVA